MGDMPERIGAWKTSDDHNDGRWSKNAGHNCTKYILEDIHKDVLDQWANDRQKAIWYYAEREKKTALVKALEAYMGVPLIDVSPDIAGQFRSAQENAEEALKKAKSND